MCTYKKLTCTICFFIPVCFLTWPHNFVMQTPLTSTANPDSLTFSKDFAGAQLNYPSP